MTRDLADTVKGLSEKAARAVLSAGEMETGAYRVAAVFEPAIRDLIAQEREACANEGPLFPSYEELSQRGVTHIPTYQNAWVSAQEAMAKAIRARGAKA